MRSTSAFEPVCSDVLALLWEKRKSTVVMGLLRTIQLANGELLPAASCHPCGFGIRILMMMIV